MDFFCAHIYARLKENGHILGNKNPTKQERTQVYVAKNTRIWCSRYNCKYTWQKTACISRHNFETNGRPYILGMKERFEVLLGSRQGGQESPCFSITPTVN